MPQRPVSLEIHQTPLPYAQRLESRCTDKIDLLVIHCTELPDMAMARVWGEKALYPESGTGNSGHFYIDRDGRIEQWVPIERIAHHVRGFNPQSIGIELINTGRYPDWFHAGHQQMSEAYPEPQIEALTALVNHLHMQLAGLKKVAGHEDLDTAMIASEDKPDLLIRRKVDPGPLFPWSSLMNKIPLHRVTAEDL
ncbi:MAG TPA: N-acetylmuramoyl-L-alanine amidase [Xanthomonadales bacterium]